MAELIKKTDNLNQGREKLNAAITDAEKAKVDAGKAIITSNQAQQAAADAKKDAYAALQYTVGKYLDPVDTFDDIATTYPDADDNDRVFVRDTGKVYVLQNGVWQEFLEITAGPINEVDKRLSAELKDFEADVNSRGVNLQSLGAVADGVTDITEILNSALDVYRDVFVPPGFYGISREIVLNNRRRLKGVGGSWSPRAESDTVFVWIGEENPEGTMFRISQAPVGVEPTTAITNVYFENIVLDGQGKVGYGYYAAYITDESKVRNITVKNTLKHGGRTEKAWYALFEDITAKNNKGCGITFGRESWGECNSLKINNIRAHSCGEDETYSFEDNQEWGYGVGIYNGYNLIINGLTSEKNIGTGLIFKNSKAVSGIRGAYFEDNERLSLSNKRRSIIYKSDRNGRGHFMEDIHLHGEINQPVQDGIVLLGGNPSVPVEIKNTYFGWLQAEFDNYKLDNVYYGLSDYVTGNIGRSVGVYGYNLNTLYVRNNGNDNNDGRTPLTAFATLSKAIQVAVYAERVTTIDCTGATISETSLDFSKVNKELTIIGNSAKVTNTTVNRGIEVINAKYGVILRGFQSISRILSTNSFVKVENSSITLSDTGAFGIVYGVDSDIRLLSCSLGTSISSGIMTGITATNCKITMENTDFSVFTTGRYIQLRDGSYILADKWIAAFEAGYATIDDAGYIMGGNKMRNKSGAVTFS